MPQTDTRLMALEDLAAALGLLTRLPVLASPSRGAASAWAWPLAGAVVAIIAAFCGSAALSAGLSPELAAGIALLTLVILTGAMHEDGLADSADGLWGSWDKARRLEIMADSRIGTYGVLALLLVTGMRWQALSGMFSAGSVWVPLVVAALLSRALMVTVMAALANAKGTGLSQSVGRPSASTAAIAAAIAFGPAMLLTGPVTILATLIAGLAVLTVALLARGKIGGQTGDILGAAQQAAEVTVLAVLSVALA